MKKIKFYSLLLTQSLIVSVYSMNAPMVCDVSVSSFNGEILITGLTAVENVILFDETISSDNIIWQCNPWLGNACTGDEVISDLIVGATYYLSIESDECSEFIPIIVSEDPEDCTAELSIIGNEVTVEGLTAEDNTKIFDSNFNIIWSCNPWSGSGSICGASPVFDDLILGSTYYLTVVSDVCEEWVPFSVGQSQGCSANFSVTNGEITMTGLTADMSVALFDDIGGIIFKCKPGQTSCFDTEMVSNLNSGETYYLSVQSTSCDEWIPIIIDEEVGAQECEVNLANFSTLCIRINEDASFSSTSINQNPLEFGGIQTNYAADGSIMSTAPVQALSEIDFNENIIYEFSAIDNTIQTVEIDPEIKSLYEIGNNLLLPQAAKNANNEFFVIGRIVSNQIPVPPSSGVIPNQATDYLTIYRLDENGNQIDSKEFASLNWFASDYQQDLQDQLEDISLIPRADGGVDILLGQKFEPSASNSFPTTNYYKYQLDPNFDSVSTTFSGVSNSQSLKIFTTQFSACDLVTITTIDEEIIGNDESNTYATRELWDYMVTPPKLLYTIYESVYTNTVSMYSTTEKGIFASFAPGIEARSYQNFYSNAPASDVMLRLTDFGSNQVLIEEIIPDIPSALIPLEGGTNLNYIIDNTLYLGDCESLSPRISENNKDRFKISALFPNPTTDEAILQIESLNNQQASMNIYDVVGKLQSSESVDLEIGNNNFIINLNDFKAGIYNVMIIDDTNQMQSSRIVKIRL